MAHESNKPNWLHIHSYLWVWLDNEHSIHKSFCAAWVHLKHLGDIHKWILIFHYCRLLLKHDLISSRRKKRQKGNREGNLISWRKPCSLGTLWSSWSWEEPQGENCQESGAGKHWGSRHICSPVASFLSTWKLSTWTDPRTGLYIRT